MTTEEWNDKPAGGPRMTPTTLAETILRDVPRYTFDTNGELLYEREVLAALTAALDPAIAEKAGEEIESLRLWNRDDAADLITALMTANAALRVEVRKSAMDAVSAGCQAQEAWEAQKAAEAERDALRGEIAFTATDGQRLLRKIDVIGVCDDPDFCFDSEGSVARCGPCAVKIAARDGVALNEYTRSNPQAMRLRRELIAAEAQIAALTARVEGLTGALSKLHHAVCGETGFAACVRLDSGKAYPWPALDDADETARAALSITEATQ